MLSVAMLCAPVLLSRLTRSSSSKAHQVVAADVAADLAARSTGSRASRSAALSRAVADGVVTDPAVVTLATSPPEAPSSTSTTMRIVEVRAVAAVTTTTVRPKPTTTTTAKPKPTTTTTTAPRNIQTGQASWYDAPAGTCAHRTAPLGTVITVTNTATGQTTTCKVSDRGPFSSGRIIDLSKDTFDRIGDPASGVIDVRISW